MRRISSEESGVYAVMLGLAMVLILGLSALALDGGNTYQVHRAAQNAADNAGVTAAYTECWGGTTAEAINAGLDASAANGFDDTDEDVTVTITREDKDRYHVEVRAEVEAVFAQILGVSEIPTSAAAVVSCTPGGLSGTTIHANADWCDEDELVDINGDNIVINGGVHSNDGLRARADGLEVYGGTFYVTGIQSPGDDQVFDPAPQQVPVTPWPYEWDIADYQPGGSIAAAADAAGLYHSYTGKQEFKDKPYDPGIYYVDGELTLGGDTFTVDDPTGIGVTFVATGKIKVKADSIDIEHYGVAQPGGSANNGLLLFSNYFYKDGCEKKAIEIRGDVAVYSGVMFAPNGKIDIKADGAQATALWSNSVKLDGNGLDLEFPQSVQTGDPKVVFEQ